MLLKYIFPVFFLFIGAIIIVAHEFDADLSNALSDVKDFAAAVSTASGPSIDFLKELSRMTTYTAAVLKTVGPIGSLIATSLKIGFPEESPEYKAIALLSEKMNHRFDEINYQIEQSLELLQKQVLDSEYREHIRMVVEAIKPLLFEIIDPKNGGSAHVWADFKRQCLSDKMSPIYGLRYLQDMLHKCPLPGPKESMRLARIGTIFLTVESRVLNKDKSQYFALSQLTRVKNDIIHGLMAVPEEKFIEKLSNFSEQIHRPIGHEDYMDLANHMRRLVNELDLSTEDDECLLSILSETYDYQRGPLFSNSELIKSDLLIMSIVAGICVNITADTPYQVEKKLLEIEFIVTQIITKLRNWLTRALENQWPALTILHLQKSISTSEKILPSGYGEVVTTLKTLADAMGPPSFKHRVLVAQASDLPENNTSYFTHCPKNLCLTIPDYKGIHIFVTRFNASEDLVRAKRADNWFDSKNAEFSKAISSLGYRSIKLPVLFDEVNWAMHGDLKNSSIYRTWVILQMEVYFSKQCYFTTGITTTPLILGINPAANWHFQLLNPSIFHDSKCYTFYGFL